MVLPKSKKFSFRRKPYSIILIKKNRSSHKKKAIFNYSHSHRHEELISLNSSHYSLFVVKWYLCPNFLPLVYPRIVPCCMVRGSVLFNKSLASVFFSANSSHCHRINKYYPQHYLQNPIINISWVPAPHFPFINILVSLNMATIQS